jgi:hypothetical protein
MRKQKLILNRQEEADIHQQDSAQVEPMPNKIFICESVLTSDKQHTHYRVYIELYILITF